MRDDADLQILLNPRPDHGPGPAFLGPTATEAVRRVHEAQPQARIILHAVMHANRYVSNSYEYYSVENLEKVNAGLRELAEGYDWVWFVDCNAPFCDEDGYLYDHMSMDGEHLLPEYSVVWAEEIRRQAVTG